MARQTLVFTLADLAQRIGAELVGNPDHQITALATLQSATESDLSFIANPAYKKFLSSSNAGAVIVPRDLVDAFDGNKLVAANPYLGYAQLTALFNPYLNHNKGIHPAAVIGSDCVIGKDVCICANAVIEDGAVLGDNVFIGQGSVVGADTVIGSGTKLYANVTVYHGITIGKACVFHSGCVIGADGFGFSPSPQGWIKIHQLGGVSIGDNVEVGANTTIDRGALDDTVIGDGVIIDNLVQIAHNVRLGKNTAIAANVGIAGSTTIGENCIIAGAAGIAGHLTLVDNVQITAMSMITSSINEPGSYSSGIPQAPTKEWRKNAARFRNLDALAHRLIDLEKGQKDK